MSIEKAIVSAANKNLTRLQENINTILYEKAKDKVEDMRQKLAKDILKK